MAILIEQERDTVAACLDRLSFLFCEVTPTKARLYSTLPNGDNFAAIAFCDTIKNSYFTFINI